MPDLRVSASSRFTLSAQAPEPRFHRVLGRCRRGDKVMLSCSVPSVPDHAPIAVVLNSDSHVVATIALPKIGPSRKLFGMSVFIGTAFIVGNYLVSYQFSVGGNSGSVPDDRFAVVPGGDSGGDVISLYSFDRPEARFVVAQLSSGRLAQGRNPSF